MYSELVFSCGCVARGHKSTATCVNHGNQVIASSNSRKRKRQTYTADNPDVVAELTPFKGSASELFYQAFAETGKAFKYDLLIVPNDFPLNLGLRTVIMRNVKPDMIKGKNVAVIGLQSLKALRYFLKHAKALHVHTESPMVFRAIKCPSIIDTMSFCGSGKFNGKNKKAA